jgi:hypothetical protein
MRRSRNGRTASNQRGSSKHHPVNDPPPANDATNDDGTVSANNGASRTDNKPAE